MIKIRNCEICLKEYLPEEVKGIRTLKVLKGYIFDLRLRQFRKANIKEELVFIEFGSKEGLVLLKKMHLALLN